MSPRILVAGGYGVFGALLTREILRTSNDAHVIVAGRDGEKANASVALLGPRASAETLDVRRLDEVERLAASVDVVVCAAGPFQDLEPALPHVVAAAGASWLDIADEPAWVDRVLGNPSLAEAARASGVVVSSGLSSVPAVSGFLARLCLEGLAGAEKARVTLFIGNKNPKGAGAIASALAGAFTEPVTVETPLGRFRAYRFPSPDERLMRNDLGIDAEFRVALELRTAGAAASALGRLAERTRARDALARAAARASAPLRVLGSDAGLVLVEALNANGDRTWACAMGRGQRIAVVPCATAAIAASRKEIPPGVAHPAEWCTRDEWLGMLRDAGVTVVRGGASGSRQPEA